MALVVDQTDVAPHRAPPARRSVGEWLRRGALHWRAALLWLLLPILAALLAMPFLPTTYEAEARLLVRIGDEYAAFAGRGGDQPAVDPARIVQTEAGILAGNAIRRAALQTVGPLTVYPQLALATPAPAEVVLDQATHLLGGQLRVESEPNSYIFRIAFRHADPTVAAAVVDGVVKAFLDQRRLLFSRDQGKALATARDQVKAELDAAERGIAAMRKTDGTLQIDARRTELADRRHEQEELLRRLEARRAGLDGAAAASRAAQPAPTPPKPASAAERARSWETEQLRQRLVDAQADRARLISIFGPQSTAILDRQIAILKKQLDAEQPPAAAPGRRPQPPQRDPLTADRSRLDRDIAAAAEQLRDTRAELRAAEERLSALAQSPELMPLLRRRAALAELYGDYARRTEQAALDDDTRPAQSANVVVIEPARVPTRGQDRRIQVLAAGLALGLLLGPAAALVLAATRRVLLTPDDAARLGLPCLGAAAAPGRGRRRRNEAAAPLAAEHLPRLNEILPIVQALRAAPAAAPGTTAPHTILFVSLPPETPSGHVLVRDVAMALAEDEGKPVLLVDAASNVHNSYFSARKLIAEPMAEAFMGPAQPDPGEARLPPQAAATGARAVVLRARRVVGAPLFVARAEDALPALAALRAAKGGAGDDELSRRFVRIVIDGSAALNDFRILRETASADGTVAMLTAETTTDSEARRLLDRIGTLGGHVLGTVLLDQRRG